VKAWSQRVSVSINQLVPENLDTAHHHHHQVHQVHLHHPVTVGPHQMLFVHDLPLLPSLDQLDERVREQLPCFAIILPTEICRQ